MSSDPEQIPSPAEIKAFRESARQSQRAFADALDVNQTTVISWEKGRTTPSGIELRALRAVMGLSNPEQSRQVREPEPDYEILPGTGLAPADETPPHIRAALHGRLSEVRLMQRFVDDRLDSILAALARYSITLPEDEAATRPARRAGKG